MSTFTYHPDWHPDDTDSPAHTYTCSACQWLYYQGDPAFHATRTDGDSPAKVSQIFICESCFLEMANARTRHLLEG